MKVSFFRRKPSEPITILLPCKDQKKAYFLEAIGSVIAQDSQDWVLLVLTDPDSPPAIAEWATSSQDERIQVLTCPERGFAQALNHGLRAAQTTFVSILLSDDRYARRAIRTLQAYRARYPLADFFHSARRHVGPSGEFAESVPSRKLRMEDFATYGSPVKHLLCWRRELAISIGGMDETLSLHGCDDYDFPWRMAEAGARFQMIKECLYEYRIHHAFDRLTTTVPVAQQMALIGAMFEHHRVSADIRDRFLQRAPDGYLIKEFTDQIADHRGALISVRYFRESDSPGDFLRSGFKQRNWFPHRVYVLPKGGPDGMKLAARITGCREPGRMREFVLYAKAPAIEEFPREVFYDDDLQWHQQQFGIDGQIACACALREDSGLRVYVMISDLVQRVARATQLRTRIDNRFHGWNRLLLNAALQYALESGLSTVWVPASGLVLRNTDQRRTPKPELFVRIYDDAPREFGGTREGDWWRLDVQQVRARIASLARGYEVDMWPKTICIYHDIERGLGHEATDPGFARQAERESPEALRRMLEIEAQRGVRATYGIVGKLLGETRAAVERGGHAIAFHSYDHRPPSGASDAAEQLRQCRDVDYRIKGYRLPQSKLHGLTDPVFAEWNFEWLASSSYSFGFDMPKLSNGLVKIPVHRDDHEMFRSGISFEAWRNGIVELARNRDFTVIGLHDCYAQFWLPHYEQFLRELLRDAVPMTLNEVAARFTLGRSFWFEET